MLISNICLYIRQNIDSDLSLDTVARHFGYSKFHLSRKFKEETGYTYKQYIEALKIERSIAAMMGVDGTSKEAFIDSNHESSGTFSNTFKKLTGLSPKLYQKSLAALGHTLISVIKLRGQVVYRHSQVGQGALGQQGGRVAVTLNYPRVHTDRVTFIGLFPTAIPNSPPVVGLALYKETHCVLDQVPRGAYYLLVTEIDLTADIANYFLLNHNYRAKLDQPLQIDDQTDLHINLDMRLSVPQDPPIVVNLPLLVKKALKV